MACLEHQLYHVREKVSTGAVRFKRTDNGVRGVGLGARSCPALLKPLDFPFSVYHEYILIRCSGGTIKILLLVRHGEQIIGGMETSMPRRSSS